ncbi:MAG: dicarboxylate/amino acid:cation symporter [Huintestinicola sp.]
MMLMKKKKIGSASKIFIGLVLGAVTGIILNYFVPSGFFRDDLLVDGIFYIIGNGFLRLMKMLVVPLVFTSLICGSSSMGDTKALGKVGVRTVGFYLFTTAAAVVVAITVSHMIDPGVGLDMNAIVPYETTASESMGLADTLLNIIPENPFNALSSGVMLQIIFFALITGVLLAGMGESGELLLKFANQASDLMMKMTMLVMKAAPAGVFCMIARTFSGLGFDAFVPLLKYMGSVTAGLAVQCFVVYMLMLYFFTRLNPLKFLKKFLPVMGFAFSTAASNATIPMSIETLDEQMGVSQKISSFTIPLGATINMDGTSIMQGAAVVFAAQAYGIELGLKGYLTVIATATIASIGTAGVPGVGLITLSMVFESVGLPIEAIALIMGIDRILDMLRTAVNITGDAVCTTIVAHRSNYLDADVFNGAK